MRRVALVHGWGGSYAATWQADGWDDALRDAGIEPVGVDIPGHGPTGGSHDPADYADLASDLAAKLPEGLHGAIGFSLGTKLLLLSQAELLCHRARLELQVRKIHACQPEIADLEIAVRINKEVSCTA